MLRYRMDQQVRHKLKGSQIQQNRAPKILHNKDFRTPTKQLHKELNLLLV